MSDKEKDESKHEEEENEAHWINPRMVLFGISDIKRMAYAVHLVYYIILNVNTDYLATENRL